MERVEALEKKVAALEKLVMVLCETVKELQSDVRSNALSPAERTALALNTPIGGY